MSKNEVLEQVYPDELKYIFKKKREKEIQRYEGYRHMMIAIAAGFGAKTEDDESLYEIYNRQLDQIIDELKGRRVALDMGIKITGTMGILLKSKRKGLVKSLKPLLDEMIEKNIRIGSNLYKEILKEAGEL